MNDSTGSFRPPTSILIQGELRASNGCAPCRTIVILRQARVRDEPCASAPGLFCRRTGHFGRACRRRPACDIVAISGAGRLQPASHRTARRWLHGTWHIVTGPARLPPGGEYLSDPRRYSRARGRQFNRLRLRLPARPDYAFKQGGDGRWCLCTAGALRAERRRLAEPQLAVQFIEIVGFLSGRKAESSPNCRHHPHWSSTGVSLRPRQTAGARCIGALRGPAMDDFSLGGRRMKNGRPVRRASPATLIQTEDR